MLDIGGSQAYLSPQFGGVPSRGDLYGVPVALFKA